VKEKPQSAKKGIFQIPCLHCKQPVSFALLELEDCVIECAHCKKKYAIGDQTLKRQLAQFARLCREIRASEEILGSSSVAVDVGPHSVKIPFKILLTRLKSTLDLKIGSEQVSVVFRTEPVTVGHEPT